ncbi:YceD family protein [Fuchsiella alkaliacetigena]|uniref:YceD family protein n=1 Tax=Fuchsiella alkaliacetigena TaxID=957042 RepID=UPI00200B079A|nr:DUF177 domain-containing protein [Fuchsiella alkaliacetigena]MCK8823957.1 DUF177 domain-containing protein [Fuchsiella alkaliacetigena]
MKIIIDNIIEDVGAYKELEAEINPLDIKIIDREIEITKPINLKLHVINAEDEFLISGDISLEFNVACSRCLKRFDLPLVIEINEEVSKDRVEAARNSIIDISKEVRDNIMVAIPMNPVCDQNCAGLCPGCGLNLNEDDCDCFMHTVDPRLAKLEELLDNN